ncbi:MAG: archaellin/type IV pilin N-terminal domain-containing protein [Dehalococcoidales bacterium]
MLKKFLRHEKGITGLETAIILIAFVVVAAVFAYTALSAGLFSTQKGQEAVYSGLKEARSTIELRGAVTAVAPAAGATSNISQISFTIANVLGGEPVDFTPPTPSLSANGTAGGTANKVVINYIDQDQTVTNLFWTVKALGKDNNNYLLETDEKFQITIGNDGNGDFTGATPGNLLNALNSSHLLGVNKTFSLVVVTPVGAVMEIERTTPPYMDKIMNLR